MISKRHIAALFLALFAVVHISGQQTDVIRDTTVAADHDTIRMRLGVSSGAIDAPVTYRAAGTKINDLVNRKVYLIDGAEVTYGNIFLRADSIVLDMDEATVYASGRRDSTGNLTGTALFREGNEEFEVKSLKYNFRTERAIIHNVVTQQEDGFLHSSVTKMHDDGTLHLGGSSYTTCDAEHPHFKIVMPRSKVYPGERIVSGPAYLVIEDIPLPIILPFGYFPVQERLASGIIMPRYGQEQLRGYYLADGGFYFAGNDYFDLRLTGNIYTNGTWLGSANTRYNLRYRFSGNFSFSYANNVTGYRGLEDYSRSRNYRVTWSHAQDPKAHPGSRFSASVNMSSSNFDRNNTYQPLENVTTQRNSSVSYSRNWAGTPFNLQASLNHSQNVANQTVNLNLPNVIFNVSRIFPFRSRTAAGPSRWYEDIQFQYTARMNNQISTYDSLLFTRHVWSDSRAGFKHDIPLSFQVQPFNNFSISPSLSYSGVLYPSRIERRWEPDHFDPDLNQISPRVVTDTISGLFYGHALRPSIRASFSPQMFVFFTPLRRDSRVEAVRQVIRPSFSFSYVPHIEQLASSMYREVQRDTLGNISTYSIFENSLYGTPSLPGRSGNVSISLGNIVEAKVFERGDTTGEATNRRLIEGLNFSTNYNLFADSLNWSPVTMSFRTTLLDQISVTASGNWSIYDTDTTGRTIDRYRWESGKGVASLQNFRTSVSFDLGRLIQGWMGSGDNGGHSTARQGRTGGGGATPENGGQFPSAHNGHNGDSRFDDYGYMRVDLPWSMSIAYSYSYTRFMTDSRRSQQVTFTGDLRIGEKMWISYVSGYDIKQREVTMTRIGVERDLHCWQMSFNWVPTGYLRSWDFTLRVTSAILSDLKYERRRDYRDNF